ncbi:unnamed protein product, partial [Discosporangium mesarthrocarpum]
MELLAAVLAHVLANITTTIFFAVVWCNFLLFKDYIWTLLWSFVISQALYSSKKRLVEVMAALSGEKDRPILAVLWDVITQGISERQKPGRGIATLLFEAVLENCIVLFALVGLLSLTSHLWPIWFLLLTAIFAILPVLGFVYIMDRGVFAYRAFVSDEMLASVVVIAMFFSSVCFIVLFLGLESVLEGITVG